jgi:hypothetical protein
MFHTPVFKASYIVWVASVEHEMTSFLQSLIEAEFELRLNSFIDGKDTKCNPSHDTGEEGRRGMWIHLQGSSRHVRSSVSPRLGPTKRDKQKINKGEKQNKEERHKQMRNKRLRDIERQVKRKAERNSGRMKIRKK